MKSEVIIYEIARDIKEIRHRIGSRMKQYFREIDLTAPQGMLVMILNKYESLKISVISQKMGLSNSTVSGIVDRLEDRDYVKRERSSKDRRVVNVHLSDKMKKMMDGHSGVLEKMMQEVFGDATSEELEEIQKALIIMKRLFESKEIEDD